MTLQKDKPANHRQKYVMGLGWGLFILLLLIIRYLTPIPISQITRDPLVLAGRPFYFGLLSNVGVLMWSASAAICIFTATLFFVTHQQPEVARFFAAFGGLSVWLTLDDLFMLHEQIEQLFGTIAEKLFFAIYGVIIVTILLRFRKIILRTHPTLLCISLLFFMASLTLDVVIPKPWLPSKEDTFLLEDGAKLLAIFTWTVYFWTVALNRILSLTERRAL